ncbi:predicted protein [Naegleria gruberi]|uniref:Predicted protein n=1 Tax=Naegleria gruberi TaxID=5762 RepID=D2VTM0_NAEGR|nr:uncharacterized protein NAEGRDRAFT_72351 [Naegleria gruberi]EFC39955.1 predicted protein [Naegleria gruberi]|eukprot:XP_002672699.1 predicted protein [Naegleria gruberi strain NEG-M]
MRLKEDFGSIDEDAEDGSLLIEETPRFNEIREEPNQHHHTMSIDEYSSQQDIDTEDELEHQHLQQTIEESEDQHDADYDDDDEEEIEEEPQEIIEEIKDSNYSSTRNSKSNFDMNSTIEEVNLSTISSTSEENNDNNKQKESNPQQPNNLHTSSNNSSTMVTSPKEGTNKGNNNTNEEESGSRPTSSCSNISLGPKRGNLSIVAPPNPYASMDRMSVTPSTQNTPKNTSQPSTGRSSTPTGMKKKTVATSGLTTLSATHQGSKHHSHSDFSLNHDTGAASKLPNIKKKNGFKLDHHEVDNSKPIQIVNERRVKSPQMVLENSVTSVLNKKGLGIKRTGAISGKMKPSWHSCEKLPKPGVNSIPHQAKTMDIYGREEMCSSPNESLHQNSADNSQRASPNFMTKTQRSAFQERLIKENYQSVKEDSELSKILFGEIPEAEFEEFGIERQELNASSFGTSSKKLSPMLKTWNGFSAKDSYVHSLMSTTKEDNGLKSLKYNLGSMVSYENKKFKPPLLEAMENFIAKELHLVTREMKKENVIMNEVEYIAAKSNVYKECFRIFIDHSRTYGPILTHILEEFSTAVEELKLKLTMPNDKFNQHHTKREEESLKMHKVYRDTSKEIEMVKQQNSNLEKEVLAMREKEAGLLETIEKLGVDIRKYEKRRNDDIKRSMILNDAIQYRDLKETEIKRQLSGLQGVAQEKNKIEQLYVESLQELDKLNNMVPKADYQEVLSRNDLLEEELKNTKVKLTQEQRISKLLNEKLNELKLNITVLEERILDQSRSLTPRPKWDLVRDDLRIESLPLDSNTIENVNQLANRVSKLQILVKKQQKELQENAKALEFLKSDDVVREKVYNNYFMGLGTGPSVPKYLRHRGRIRNKRFKKKDIMGIVNDMWKARMKQREGPERYKDTISDFFESFVTMKVGNIGSIKAELIYNIVFGAEHFTWDTDCYLFTKIIKGDVSELVFFELFSMIEQLRKMFVKLDETESGIADGTVQKKNANKQLEYFFEGKAPDDILKIKIDMHKDQRDAVVKYERLFQQDNEGFDGRFLTTIKRQFIREVEEYNIEVEEWLREKEDREGALPLKRVKEIFEYKQVCKDNLDKLLRFGVHAEPNEELDFEQHINIEEFMNNVRNKMVLRRTSFKDVGEMKFEFELEKQLESIDESTAETNIEKVLQSPKGSDTKSSMQSPRFSETKSTARSIPDASTIEIRY